MPRMMVKVLLLAATCAAIQIQGPTDAPTYATDAPTTAPPPFCPKVVEKILELPFNPAFLTLDEEFEPELEGLGATFSTFFNGGDVPDGVWRVEAPSGDVEASMAFPLVEGGPFIEPREVRRAPTGFFGNRKVVVVPQGFLSIPEPGRLSIVDLDTQEEFVISQSSQDPTQPLFSPGNTPHWYNKVVFADIDVDGLLDVVTVRSTFKVVPTFYPPTGELVCFINPGTEDGVWEEAVLVGGPAVGFQGPDVNLDAIDYDGDGVPEFVATHFFTQPPKIAIYGAPAGGTWTSGGQYRSQDVALDQGRPFDVQFVDVNNDGLPDVLATNHQGDVCGAVVDDPPGRVFVLQLTKTDPFAEDAWVTHVLLDEIRPQPTVPPPPPGVQGRLAPGRAGPFYPEEPPSTGPPPQKPWIFVGGDEAAKMWVLRPATEDPNDWTYESAVLFDINDAFGPGTTQVVSETGVSISTTGRVAIRYQKQSKKPELLLPLFEARELRIFRFLGGDDDTCPADVLLDCP